jgi:hypothetical protein
MSFGTDDHLPRRARCTLAVALETVDHITDTLLKPADLPLDGTKLGEQAVDIAAGRQVEHMPEPTGGVLGSFGNVSSDRVGQSDGDDDSFGAEHSMHVAVHCGRHRRQRRPPDRIVRHDSPCVGSSCVEILNRY